ncbi:FecR domain-containing protein [Candidatus Binatus sp.]|uniref:FecR domain-containing protein n=2 Tax=Candidatus Binatus sp. TaxID=2811406 RepID=UPI003C3BF2CA
MNKIKSDNDRSRIRINNRSIAFVAASVMLGLGLLASSPARAVDSVGSVTQISGSAQIERGDATLPVQQGTPVLVQDKVMTQAGAAVTLGFVDGSSIGLSGSTSIAIRDRGTVNGQTIASRVTLISGDIHTVVPDKPGQPPAEVNTDNSKATGASPNQ